MATLPEKSFQGQPLLEKNNQVQKIQIILGKKFLLPSSDLTEKNSLPQRQIWIKSSADKKHKLYQQTKKNCQNAASRFCDYIIISRGCSSHFLDIWIRTNPLLSAEKKTCRKPSFSNFLLLLVESPCIFFWLETQSYIWLSHVTDLNQKSCSTTGFVDPFSTTSK